MKFYFQHFYYTILFLAVEGNKAGNVKVLLENPKINANEISTVL